VHRTSKTTDNSRNNITGSQYNMNTYSTSVKMTVSICKRGRGFTFVAWLSG